ncbi:serine protease (plasmid) [Stanieria sp. NIES-3757]|nr:serine protease [Stanieria sp. NIES-3757]
MIYKQKKRNLKRKIVGQIIITMLVVLVTINYTLAQNFSNSYLKVKSNFEMAKNQEKTPQEIYEKASKAIVTVKTDNNIGRGFIVEAGRSCSHSEFAVITNSHIVEDNWKVKVILANGEEYSGYVFKTDERADLAAISFKLPLLPSFLAQKKPLPTLDTLFFPFMFFNYARVGEPVYTINSSEETSNSFAAGTISSIDPESGILHDAFITHLDSSGSPLLNSQGRVIGVNSGKSEAGLNHAVSLEKIEIFVNPFVVTKICFN